MKNSLLIVIILAGLAPFQSMRAQGVEGRILDQKTKRPLAFVNVVYKENGQGTVSNIDGEFSIASFENIEFLKFSYVGYHSKFISRQEIQPGKKIPVRLEKKTYDIEEVEILPGINPAHRIIRLAFENRNLNNPEKMQSFSYTSYSKMYFTLDLDSMYGSDRRSWSRTRCRMGCRRATADGLVAGGKPW